MPAREIKVVPDVKAMMQEAAQRIIAASRAAIQDHGFFSIALSGGSTPKALYELLAQEPYRSQIDWSRVRIFFGDERCVPPDDSQSNYRMAKEALLSKVPIPQSNVYRMKGEIDPQAAATEYGQILKDQFGDGGLDLTLLGMGDDGHTASLFPGTPALHETKHRCVPNYVEKLKVWRITLTAPFLNRSKAVMILASGAAKAHRLKEVLEGPRDPDRLPIQLIQPTAGTLTWLLDNPAAAMVKA